MGEKKREQVTGEGSGRVRAQKESLKKCPKRPARFVHDVPTRPDHRLLALYSLLRTLLRKTIPAT